MASATVSNQWRGSPQPRIQITYPVEVEGTWVEKELPFVIGVLGDFSGQPSQPLRHVRERRFVQVDQSNFNDVMARAAPGVATSVWNRLTNDDSKLAIELKFRRIDDFEPACIAAQVLPLKVLMDMRLRLMQLLSKLEGNGKLQQWLADMRNNPESVGKLAGQIGIEMDAPAADAPEADDALSLLDQVVAATRPQSSHEQNRAKDYIGPFVGYIVQPGRVVSNDIEINIKTWVSEIDKKLSAQLDEIMHDPSLQMLESSWRGLHHLVSNKETSANVAIKVLNVLKQEIFKDLDRAVEIDQSLSLQEGPRGRTRYSER